MRFFNDFDMGAVKRLYVIANSAMQPKRGWIMHKRETKWFFPLRGKTVIRTESDLDCLPPNEHPLTYTLDAARPSILCVPPCHWFMIEQDGAAEVQVFSNCYIGEYPNDDYRK